MSVRVFVVVVTSFSRFHCASPPSFVSLHFNPGVFRHYISEVSLLYPSANPLTITLSLLLNKQYWSVAGYKKVHDKFRLKPP